MGASFLIFYPRMRGSNARRETRDARRETRRRTKRRRMSKRTLHHGLYDPPERADGEVFPVIQRYATRGRHVVSLRSLKLKCRRARSFRTRFNAARFDVHAVEGRIDRSFVRFVCLFVFVFCLFVFLFVCFCFCLFCVCFCCFICVNSECPAVIPKSHVSIRRKQTSARKRSALGVRFDRIRFVAAGAGDRRRRAFARVDFFVSRHRRDGREECTVDTRSVNRESGIGNLLAGGWVAAALHCIEFTSYRHPVDSRACVGVEI